MTDELNLNIEWTEAPTCPLCDNDNHEHFHTYIPDKRPITHWRICTECGHVFCSPRPTEAWLDAWYKHGYRMMSYGTEDAEQVPTRAVQDEVMRAMRLCHMLLRTVRKVSRVLDIGSSSGTLLAGIFDKFQPTMGYGVEPNDAWRTFAEMRSAECPDLPGRIEFVDKLKKVPKSPLFDLVTIVHTLEHVPDPLGMLQLIRNKYLRKDGHILVETPRLDGGRSDPLLFPHIHCYHHDTLLGLVTKAGFHPIIFETPTERLQKAPIYISPNSITVVASVKKQTHDVANMLERYNLCREHSAFAMAQLKDVEAKQAVYQEG